MRFILNSSYASWELIEPLDVTTKHATSSQYRFQVKSLISALKIVYDLNEVFISHGENFFTFMGLPFASFV